MATRKRAGTKRKAETEKKAPPKKRTKANEQSFDVVDAAKEFTLTIERCDS